MSDDCTTLGCPTPGTITGIYDDGYERQRVLYCADCAEVLPDEFTPDTHLVNDLSAEPNADFEAARARWEAAEDAEEATVERVARAIAEAQDAHGHFGFPCRCGWLAEFGAGWEERVERHRLAAQARAAIDAITTPVRQEAGR